MALQNKISKIWANIDKTWYDELKVIAPYREYQYDRIIQSHLQTLFPEYYALYYDRTIKQPLHQRGSKPDFAMIRKDFNEWWIVEVERVEDNLFNVRKQIEDFVNGEYNPITEARYLYKNSENSIDYDGLYIVTQSPPKVMVIVDDADSKWETELEDLNPVTCILKLYRNKNGHDVLSISGDYPYIFEEESHCYFFDAMKNLLLLTNPDILDPVFDQKQNKFLWARKTIAFCKKHLLKQNIIEKKDIYVITYKGQTSEWKKIEDSGKTFLQPLGPSSTRVNESYKLKRTKSKVYILEIN